MKPKITKCHLSSFFIMLHNIMFHARLDVKVQWFFQKEAF